MFFFLSNYSPTISQSYYLLVWINRKNKAQKIHDFSINL